MNGNIIKSKNVGKYKGENILKINEKLLDENYEDYKVFIRIYDSIENDIIYYPIQFANDNIYDKNLKAHLIFSVDKNGKIFR